MQSDKLLWWTVDHFLMLLNIHLLYHSAIPFLTIYSKKENLCSHKDLIVNFYRRLIHHFPKLEIAHVTSKRQWIDYGAPIQWNITQEQIGMNFWFKQQHRWILSCCVKQVQPQGLHIVWFYYMTFWIRLSYKDGKQSSGCQGLGDDGKGWLQMEIMREFGRWGMDLVSKELWQSINDFSFVQNS